jgi:hypothetical protein
VLLHHGLQPFLGQIHFQAGDALDALEVLPEGLVEAVEVGFVLDQAAAARK